MNALTQKFFQAETLVLNDYPREPVDVTFFFGRGKNDEDGLFELVSELRNRGVVKNVIINGSNGERFGGNIPGEAWAGKDAWTRKLKAFGIQSILYSRPAFNTKEEARAFYDYALEQGWKSGVVVAQPHQLLRAILTFIKIINEQNHFLKIYSTSPEDTDWQKKVYGSQSLRELSRFDHIAEEWKRIDKYTKIGDLATLDELFAYYQKR